MESHALHADGLYYESGDNDANARLWVNLYAPSTADWKSAGVKLEVATDLPVGQSATVKISPAIFEEVHPRWVTSILGGRGIQRQSQRQCS